MLFNSFAFFIFFPIVATLFFLTHQRRPALALWILIASSLVYYGWWNISFLSVFLASIVFNFSGGKILRRIDSQNKRRLIFLCFVAIDLSILGYFKYYNFFITNLNQVLSSNLTLIQVGIPLGISFFTFQQISYLIECYHNPKVKDFPFSHYMLFVSFFPHLIAGPLVHHKEIIPQFEQIGDKELSWKNIGAGFTIFIIGLSKKLLIADPLSVFVGLGYRHTQDMGIIPATITVLSYTFQIYFDFSGYIDMASGAALILDFHLPQNFNSPYRSSNLQDFWRRWNITLGRFLREGIYIPLGGNQRHTYFNLIATFLIGGLWHGANWTFIIWGALHGVGLCVVQSFRSYPFRMSFRSGQILTFIFVVFTWIFFRASNFGEAISLLKAFGKLNTDLSLYTELSIFDKGFGLIALIAGSFIVVQKKNSNHLRTDYGRRWYHSMAIIILMLACFIFLNSEGGKEFIYYDF